jgi:transcriptional regulator GlxA family with amidase domain
MIMLGLSNGKTTTSTFGSVGKAETTLAQLLAGAQVELDRLHSIARRAGYTIIFRDPSGAIIDHAASSVDASRPVVRGGLAPGALRRVREYVEANLEAKIELADLAARANLSRCHFAYAFKQSVGCTPHRYVVSRRLEKARELLAENRLPISEIAVATGFADQSHFSRCFRAFFGLSPLAFRRSAGEWSQLSIAASASDQARSGD